MTKSLSAVGSYRSSFHSVLELKWPGYLLCHPTDDYCLNGTLLATTANPDLEKLDRDLKTLFRKSQYWD